MKKVILSTWQSPFLFRAMLKPWLKLEKIWRADYQIVRDAWIGLRFAELGCCSRIRMTDDANHGPDFQVIFRSGHKISVQSIEAMEIGRQRGNEYQRWRASGWKPIHSEGLQPDDDPAVVLSSLKEAVDRKSREPYPNSMVLLVYLNVGGFFVDKAAVQRGMVDSCASGRGHFSAIWVLWGDRLYRCWPNPWLVRNTFRPVDGLDRQYVREHRLFHELFDRTH